MKTNILVTRIMEVVPCSRPTQNRPLTWDDFMVHSVNRPYVGLLVQIEKYLQVVHADESHQRTIDSYFTRGL
jgi:hypothetical protein